MRLFQPLVGSVTNYIRRLIETGAEERAAEAVRIRILVYHKIKYVGQSFIIPDGNL